MLCSKTEFRDVCDGVGGVKPIQSSSNRSPGQDRKQPREGTGLPKVTGK